MCAKKNCCGRVIFHGGAPLLISILFAGEAEGEEVFEEGGNSARC
jgi:hypothetical protein